MRTQSRTVPDSLAVRLLGASPPFGKLPQDSVVSCGQLVVAVAAFAAERGAIDVVNLSSTGSLDDIIEM